LQCDKTNDDPLFCSYIPHECKLTRPSLGKFSEDTTQLEITQ